MRRRRRAPSPTQLGFTRVGHLKLSKSDISDFDRERVGVRGYDLSIARRMGGAKRYPSIAFRGGDGFRRAQPILRTEGETRWRRITALPHTSRIAPRDANARLGVIARSEATKQSILFLQAARWIASLRSQ